MNHKENLNLVFNLPELHPRSHMYDTSFKFVGPCIDTKLHVSGNLNQSSSSSSSNSALSHLLDYFQPIDRDNIDNTKPILIYFSLGTVLKDIMIPDSVMLSGTRNAKVLSKSVVIFCISFSPLSPFKRNLFFEFIYFF